MNKLFKSSILIKQGINNSKEFMCDTD